jgi:Ca-activated chloride channel family protein
VVAYEGEAFTQIPFDDRSTRCDERHLRTGNRIARGGHGNWHGASHCGQSLERLGSRKQNHHLLTDGVNNAGQINPIDAAQLAQLNEIRVYTIGVGTIGKARSPVRKVGNRFQYDWIEVKIDEDILKQVAQIDGRTLFQSHKRR